MILMIPAGIGLQALFSAGSLRRGVAWIAALACLGVSLVLPFGDLRAAEEAASLANFASAWKRRGQLERAEALARAAVARDGDSVPAHYALGVITAARGDAAGAEAAYLAALAADPGHAESAANVALLLAGSGRGSQAIPILRRALAARPTDIACWTNLVIVHALRGDMGAARAAAREAHAAGVALDPGLLNEIGERN
jgi:Flp pilus assembly protein TadD